MFGVKMLFRKLNFHHENKSDDVQVRRKWILWQVSRLLNDETIHFIAFVNKPVSLLLFLCVLLCVFHSLGALNIEQCAMHIISMWHAYSPGFTCDYLALNLVRHNFIDYRHRSQANAGAFIVCVLCVNEWMNGYVFLCVSWKLCNVHPDRKCSNYGILMRWMIKWPRLCPVDVH